MMGILLIFYPFQADFPDDLSEDPLDNVELLQDHLEFFPYLCRYQERANSPIPVDANELAVIEGQISWIVHIIAAILKVRQITSCRFAISTYTTRYWRYISVRQVTGTWTARYQAVPPKIDRRRSISAVDGRLK
ncbi:hypothetical protein BHE74_00023438 [Ensete ventricosum]|nr:hypothetical protein BHE74_00023438 [Ensete ventricosum]